MDDSRLNEIIKALFDAGATNPCPRCNGADFDILGESDVTVRRGTGFPGTGESVVPLVLIACEHCGLVAQHALGPLKLLRKTEE